MPDRLRGKWAIVVHGGAKEIAPDVAARYRAGCERAASAGCVLLARGGSAVDAVVAAIRVLEDDPTFNAGTGAVMTSEGTVELDAALMDGRTLDVGAVAALKGARNPILIAREMLRDEEILLVGDGARRFAVARAPEAMSSEDGNDVTSTGGDTVGCVALDPDGNVAAGTSTGGLDGSPPGRVGDSPLPGCGLYAENGVGGVSLSGSGERIARVSLAAWAIERLRASEPVAVATGAIARLERVGGEAGIIVIDRAGEISWAHNSADFAVAYATSEQEVVSFTRHPVTGSRNQ